MSRDDAAKCPNCGEMIEVDFFSEAGDEIFCSFCDAELEITKRDPLRFRLIKKSTSDDEDRDLYGFNEDEDEGFE